MSKFVLLVCLTVACAADLSAQQKPAPPKPAPGAPRPSPYVLKKEYDVQIQELGSRVNSAAGSAAAVRRGMEEKFGRMTVLDSQMQKVEEILNSASFQIALTSDSLKETRFNMEEFRKRTEANVATLNAEKEDMKKMSWMLFGGAALLALLLGIFNMVKIGQARKAVMHEAEVMKMEASGEMQKIQKDLKDEMNSLKSRVQGDVSSLKSELVVQSRRDREDLMTEVKLLQHKIAAIQKTLDSMNPEDGSVQE